MTKIAAINLLLERIKEEDEFVADVTYYTDSNALRKISWIIEMPGPVTNKITLLKIGAIVIRALVEWHERDRDIDKDMDRDKNRHLIKGDI